MWKLRLGLAEGSRTTDFQLGLLVFIGAEMWKLGLTVQAVLLRVERVKHQFCLEWRGLNTRQYTSYAVSGMLIVMHSLQVPGLLGTEFAEAYYTRIVVCNSHC